MADSKGRNTPHADTHLARFLRDQIERLQGVVTVEEIARALGYRRVDIVTMFMNGEIKVPIDKIPALAGILRADTDFLMRLAFVQWWPAQSGLIPEMFKRYLVTENEAALVAAYREAADNEDYKLPDETLARIRELVTESRSIPR